MKIFLIFLLFAFINTSAQQIKMLTQTHQSSLRGLSVVNDRVIWVSGSNGMVGRSLDSGKNWKWVQVKGFTKIDFRDIEAFNETQAVIMGVGEPAYILRTIDGGESWKVVYENTTKGMFLDAMEFWNEQSGIVVGDPVKGKCFIARTFNGGDTWQPIPEKFYPVADSGEALLAASGTNIRKFGNDAACFVTGGLRSRLFLKDKKIDLPIVHGTQTSGANSIAIKDKKIFVVVGGDFNNPNDPAGNCVISFDEGVTWTTPSLAPGGYRSCVEFIEDNTWITCGLNGVDVSKDEGNTWQSISPESFHVCRKAKHGKSIFLAGENGKVGKLIK